MDWTNIFVTLITSGAFVTVYLVGDKKTASVLENVSKTIDQWRGLVDEVKADLASERKERREMLADYERRLEAKDNKLDSQYREIGVWRDRSDKLGSKVAYYRAFECRKVKCLDREPPFGSGAFREEGDGGSAAGSSGCSPKGRKSGRKPQDGAAENIEN